MIKIIIISVMTFSLLQAKQPISQEIKKYVSSLIETNNQYLPKQLKDSLITMEKTVVRNTNIFYNFTINDNGLNKKDSKSLNLLKTNKSRNIIRNSSIQETCKDEFNLGLLYMGYKITNIYKTKKNKDIKIKFDILFKDCKNN